METNLRKPKWLGKKLDYKGMGEINRMLNSLNLHSVCSEAKCPNIGECFGKRTATFLILGDICTRNCSFCAITRGLPKKTDPNEPKNLAEAAKRINLKHVVITSVTRDDLPNGGAEQFADCIREIKQVLPKSSIEVLIPDFKGNKRALDIVIEAQPEIINHNIETVPNLYEIARPMADYKQSLEVISYVKEQNDKIFSKSGFMLGLGEKKEEVYSLLRDLLEYNCDILTIGQYLPPSFQHVSLKEYVHPDVFDEYKDYAYSLGFKYVASAPYVRSSYNAIDAINEINSEK